MSEIRTYTEAELMDPEALAPAGWQRPGNLPAIVRELNETYGWAPVLSVSVFRDHPERLGEIQTLTGIRGAATTHEGVVSTLTGTFPREILPLLVQGRQRYAVGWYPTVTIGTNGPNPQETATVARYAPQLEGVPDTNNLLSFLCHDIMSRKLGRADLISMQSDDELGTVSLARMALGVSYVGDDVQQRPRYERLLMIGTAFMLHPHQAHVFDQEYQEKMSVLSESERRYSSLGWTDAVQSFPSAVRSKNVIELAPYISEGEAVSVCARGQCLAMTSELIQGSDLLWHLGRLSMDDLYYDEPVGDPYGLRDPVPLR